MTILKKFATGCATAFVLGFGALTGAQAATLDFTTATYNSTFGPNVVTDTVDGVTFTITATARGVDGFRQSFDRGLSFGVPGNGMYGLMIEADQDVVFNSFDGRGHGFPQFAGQLPFTIGLDGAPASAPFSFASVAMETLGFPNGPIALDAGRKLLFNVDFGSLTGSYFYAQAVIKSFDFNRVIPNVSAVPLPAGLALMLTGLGFFGFAGRRKKPA